MAMPFLLLLLAIATDYCRLYHITQTVENCAYVGAFYAAGYATPAPNGNGAIDLDTAAKNAAVAEGTALNPPLQASNVQVTHAQGQSIVQVTYNVAMLSTILGTSQITLTRTVTMR